MQVVAIVTVILISVLAAVLCGLAILRVVLFVAFRGAALKGLRVVRAAPSELEQGVPRKP